MEFSHNLASKIRKKTVWDKYVMAWADVCGLELPTGIQSLDRSGPTGHTQLSKAQMDDKCETRVMIGVECECMLVTRIAKPLPGLLW